MKRIICACLLNFIAFAFLNAQLTINGVVKDKKYNPINRATIINKNSKKNTITNAKGEFQLEASKNDSINVIFNGHLSSQFVIEDEKAFLQIQLTDSIKKSMK